jgi:hypothetical protein
MSSADIVQKLWNYCNVLRDDGMSANPHGLRKNRMADGGPSNMKNSSTATRQASIYSG